MLKFIRKLICPSQSHSDVIPYSDFVDAARAGMASKVGFPYIWGGDIDKSTAFTDWGLDCSGFVIGVLQDIDVLDEKYDNNCEGLYKDLIIGDEVRKPFYCEQVPLLDNKSFDYSKNQLHIIFYAKNKKRSHVSLVYNPMYIIEAGGGGRKVSSRKEAIALAEAKVRFKPINHRWDEIVNVVRINIKV